jgi:hypothetical protein
LDKKSTLSLPLTLSLTVMPNGSGVQFLVAIGVTDILNLERDDEQMILCV